MNARRFLDLARKGSIRLTGLKALPPASERAARELAGRFRPNRRKEPGTEPGNGGDAA